MTMWWAITAKKTRALTMEVDELDTAASGFLLKKC